MTLQAKFGDALQMSVWSDCGGMCSELFALKEIAATLDTDSNFRLNIVPYVYCDCNPQARHFAELNHNPVHVADNINNRDFEAGTFYCVKCGDNHPMPKAGVDLYVCCFPCGPWSARGTQIGFSHKDGDVCFQSIKTIKHVRPCTFLMENVLRIDTSHSHADPNKTDLQAIMDHMNWELEGQYNLLIVKGIDPEMAGFPVHKKRLAILGGRADIIQANVLNDCVQVLLDDPLRVRYSWRQFLGRKEKTIDWSRAWQPQLPEERVKLIDSGCVCSLDPFIRCDQHPCHCQHCRVCRTAPLCHWRKLHSQMINTKLVKSGGVTKDELIQHFSHKLSYIALIEHYGISAPSSPRERNLLNIISLFPEMHPLGSTPGILDLSQDICRIANRVDGLVGTMATNALMWSMPDANVLNNAECFKLMGHSVDKLVLDDNLSQTALKKMLGMSLHVGTAGLLVSASLSSIAS